MEEMLVFEPGNVRFWRGLGSRKGAGQAAVEKLAQVFAGHRIS